MAKLKAVFAIAVILTMLTACGSRQQTKGVGSIGLVSGAPSLGPLPSRPPSVVPGITPSRGGAGNNSGDGGHRGTSPKPNPDPPPNPQPDQPAVADYVAVIEPADSAPACAWTIHLGVPEYDLKVVALYTGPPSADPLVGYTVTDIQGAVLQTGGIEINGQQPMELHVYDHIAAPTVDQTAFLKFTVDGGADGNPKNNETSVEMVVPFASNPTTSDTFQSVPCVRVPN